MPVQDVTYRIRHNQCADDDVTEAKAGCGKAGLHSLVTIAYEHFSDRRPCTGTNVAFFKLHRGGRLAGLVSGVCVRANSRISQCQVVNHGAHNNRNANLGDSPIESDLVLLEVANRPCDRRQAHGSSPGQQNSVNRVNWTHGLKQDTQMRARCRAVVVHTCGSLALEK